MKYIVSMKCYDNGNMYEDEPCLNEPDQRAKAFKRALSCAMEECKDFQFANHDANVEYKVATNDEEFSAVVYKESFGKRETQTVYSLKKVYASAL